MPVRLVGLVLGTLWLAGCHDPMCPETGIVPGVLSTLALDSLDPDGVSTGEDVLPRCVGVDDLAAGSSIDVEVGPPGLACQPLVLSTSEFPGVTPDSTYIAGGTFGSFPVVDGMGCPGRWRVWILGSVGDLTLVRAFYATGVPECARFPGADGDHAVCGDRFFVHADP